MSDEHRSILDSDRSAGMNCARCKQATGNTHQGHYWALCTVTGTDRGFHFCCPGDCQLDAADDQP